MLGAKSLQTCARQHIEPASGRDGKRLRAAIIGLGVGEAHIAGYQGHPSCEVAALCDFSRDRLAQVGRRHPGIELYGAADDILNDPDIDIVSIASYDNYHYEHVVKAIAGDKHVFVEKPLCLSEVQARHIRELLDAKPGLRLSSNLILRGCPRFAALKGRIDRGEFGELFLIEGDYHYGRLHKITEGWRGAIDFYSVVYGGAIHIVDLLLWLTGSRITDVAAFGNQVASCGSQFRYNDTVVSALRFENGAIGKVGVSYGCVRPHFHSLSINGTKATFVNGQPDGRLYESRDPQVEPARVSDPYPGVHKGALIADFVESILSGREPMVSKEDVFRTMSVCLAIEKAVATGATCRVEYI
jgi:predicted dehydrogenase